MKLGIVVLGALAATLVTASGAMASDWSGTGTASSGNPSQPLNITFHNGTAGPAKLHYDFIDAFPNGAPGSNATGSFELSKSAGVAGDVTLPWSFTGFHAFFQVRVTLTAFVEDSGGETLYPLVNAGLANCCTEPSAGFSYAGTVTLPGVQVGDTYGFRITGSNGDSNATLQGDLAVAWVVDTAADTTTTGNCELAVANDCSLRDAITKANASPDFDGINFDIPGPGVHTISPGSALPPITGAVEIDGTTQPGFIGQPLIELSGASAGNVHGLDVRADDVGIHGLAINRFQGSGIVIPSGADRATIDGNYIGTDPGGAIDFGNAGVGIFMTSTANTRIGGPGVGQANIISGNGGGGVQFGGTGTGNLVWGNRIGTDFSGTAALTNAGPGVYASGSVSVQIGGGGSGEGNVISAASGPVANADGIQLFSDGNSVYGNKIGTNAAGTAALGNGTRGILVVGNGNQIGATSFGAGNLVSGNGNTGIEISGSDNIVEGNRVGVGAGGVSPLPNAFGVQIDVGNHNRIGGTSFGARNVISGNTASGVHINGGATLNDVQGNYIGVGSDGSTAAPNGTGVCVCQAGPLNTIGGTGAGAGNVISGNAGDGIEIGGDAGPGLDSTGNTVVGNLIGLQPDGTSLRPNGGDGIDVNSGDDTTIGGTTAGARNVISGNGGFGIRAADVADLVVQGNYVGTDASGNAPAGETEPTRQNEGIDLQSTVAAQIGGTDPGAGNVVGGNEFGIYVRFPDGGSIQGNNIGVGATGSNVGNFQACECSLGIGVTIYQTSPGLDAMTIGGTTAAARNMIGFNNGGILLLNAAAGTSVQGNWVGLRVDPDNDIAPNFTGIEVAGTDGAVIGGDTPGARNVVAANTATGIFLTGGSTHTRIEGNYVGTDVTGGNFRPNGDGVRISDSSTENVIGGNGVGQGNLISGNENDGVRIDGSTTHDNVVQGNTIGLTADSEASLENGVGVHIRGQAYSNTIGETGADPDGSTPGNTIAASDDANVTIDALSTGNVIAGNEIEDALGAGVYIEGSFNTVARNTIHDNTASFSGVDVADGYGNTISENSIYDNLGLGIDLGADGATANDPNPGSPCPPGPADCDGGPNDLQNFPVVTSAQITSGDLHVAGTIDSTLLSHDGEDAQEFTIEAFVSPDCVGAEGKTFIGSASVSPTVAGPTAWSLTDTGTTVTPGQGITTTATDVDGSTSEFSACVTATASVTPLSATIDLSQNNPNVRGGAQSVPVSGIDLAALTRGAGPNTDSAPLDGIPLEGIKIAGSPLEGIPLSGIGLTPQLLNQALGGVHLSDIPLTPPANWPTLLAGTRLANVPLATLTLADVLSLPTLPAGFNNITLGSIDLQSSPLSGIPLAGIAIGPKLLSAVPLSGIGTSPSQNLQDWCTAINAQPGYSCTSPSTLTNETVVSQVVRGVPLTGIPLDGIPLEGINLAGTPLTGIPLEGIDLSGTPLEGIPLEGINMNVSPLSGIPLTGINIIGSPLSGIPLSGIPLVGIAIDCTGGFCLPAANKTLGDAVIQNRLKPGATLGMLDGGFGSVTLDDLVDALKPGSGRSLADLAPGLPPGHTLHDLLAALLGASAYDWSTLNLNTFPLADFSADGGVAHYHVDFEVTGGALLSQPVTIHATLPAGGRYVPGSSVRSPGGSLPDPTIGAGGQLSWSFNALRDQQYTLSWDAKPGLDLGSSAVGANIQLSNGTTLATPVTTRVIQTFNDTNLLNGDTNDNPNTAPQLAGNSLYVSHLTTGDTDYYKIPIGAYGSRIELTLSHISDGSDYDMAVAGPPAPRLRTPPANTIPLGNQQLPDSNVSLDHRAQQLPPEALQDIPMGDLTGGGRVLRAVSDNRGNGNEHITLVSQGESGFYTVQITDYQGDSPDPYLLEVKTIPVPDFGPCAPRSIANSTTAAAPTVNAGTQTLFLVDEKRLIATFGTTATSTLMSKLSTFAARSDVVGSIVRVETNANVVTAYNNWDGGPCSPELANNVVRAIGSYLDALQNAAPNVKYVVVVGGDDIVPFARVPDNTEIANERTYRESLGQVDNEYLGSIGSGFLLTDDVWGEKGAPDFLGSELFVPELAVGRLVESPTDIGKTLDGFTAANGLLSPTSSLVTGYDFLTDGAQQINVPFAAGLGANAKTLINETWDRNQLLAQLFPAAGGGPKLNSLNAHFDHQRLLPAAENAANRQANLVTTADITPAMNFRLAFSLGCHSGLAVSDAIFGAANPMRTDWAQAMSGQGAAGWIGNTGYGLGDTTDVAYSERLHALFSRKLDGTLTLGQALEQAKQDYLGTSAVLTGYDAKVLMEATLYGLPMLRLGSGIPPTPPPPPPLHTDPATGLQAASFDVSPTFTNVTTANGRYYRADNGIQSTPRRPLEPLVSLDVTQPGTLVAHGALINLLNSPVADEPNFDAVFSQVTTDQAADDPTLAGVNAFPSKIQSIATFSGLTTRKQRLNLVVGLFRSDGPTLAGIGTQRRYTRVAGDTLYTTSTDWLAPELGELDALRIGVGGNVGFATNVTDPTPSGPGSIVKTVKVLYRDCNGTWRTATLLPAGGNRWSGPGTVLPAGCQSIDYYLEAADGAGNVAVSSKKVQLEPLTVPAPETPDGASPIMHTLNPPTPSASGWYTGPVQVTLTSAESIRYTVDGQDEVDYSGPFTVTGDSVHFVHARTPNGATDDIGFGIDASGPLTTITRTPDTPDVNGWYVFAVNVQVSALDPGGSDVAQIRCVLDPPGPPPTLFSQLPASCPYAGAGGYIGTNGIHKVYAAAKDGAGNAGAVVSDTVQFDNSFPVTTMGALAPFQTAASFSPTWSGTDTGSGVKNFDIRYRQAASNASTFGGYTAWQSATPALTAVFAGTAGATTCFSGRARDNAGNLSSIYSTESCSTVPLDDTSLTRSGSWSTTSAADLYGGSASRSTSVGSTLTSPTMVGKQIGVLVTKQPGGGTIQLRWNGGTQVTQSLSAASRQPKQLVSFTLGSVQSGTLQVYVSGSGTTEIDAAGAFKTP